MRSWRWKIFLATALSYSFYYFTRKPFYVAKASMAKALDLNAAHLGYLGTGFLVAYALGQFLAGWAGTRWGPRQIVLWGMAISAACNVVLGYSQIWAVLAGAMFVNGLAQATGWPGNVGTMANWFRREERGTVMGFWATNFQWGAAGATAVAAWVLARTGDYQWPFLSGAGLTMLAWLLFLVWQRNHPRDVGLPPLTEEDDEQPNSPRQRWSRDTTINVAIVGLFYFFIKFIRYALWSWVPYLLETRYHLQTDHAGYLSTVFDIAGIFGVIAAGVISDRFFRGRRTPVSLFFVIIMTFGCGLLYVPGTHTFALALAVIGFFLFGPDALLCGAGAVEVGTPRQAALAAGIINGMGSVGAVLQELVLGHLLKDGGVNAVFLCLVASSLASVCCLLVMTWRNSTGRADL